MGASPAMSPSGLKETNPLVDDPNNPVNKEEEKKEGCHIS